MVAQAKFDFLRGYGWFFGDFAFSRFRFTGGRLKTAKTLAKDFGIRNGESVEVFVPPYSFRSKITIDDALLASTFPRSFNP